MPRNTGDTVQIGPRIDKQIWEQFKQFVKDKHGKTSGVTAEEVENALQQRMGNDPLQHMDERLRRVEQAVGVDAGDSSQQPVGERETVSKDPTDEPLNPRTQQRVDEILDQLPGRFDSDQLDAAIENVAGSSYKTLRKYRELLTKRHLIVQAPWDTDGESHYKDKQRFAIAAAKNLEPEELHTLSDRLAIHWGDDWFSTELPDDMPNPLEGYSHPDGSDIGFQ